MPAAAHQCDWSPTPCEAPHHHAEPMAMRPIRHTYAPGFDHDDMMAAHFQARTAGGEGYRRYRAPAHAARLWQARPDMRYYGPGYPPPAYAGYGVPYDYGYGREYVMPAAPAPAPQPSRLGAIMYGFGGMGLAAVGATVAVAGVAHHGGIASLLIGGVLAIFGLGLANAAMKVTDPDA